MKSSQKRQGNLLLLLMTAVLYSCSPSSPGADALTIETLKPVDFAKIEAKENSAQKTGNVFPDPRDGGKNKNEYLVTVQKQYLVNPLAVVKETDSDVIYPGSIIRGDSFIEGVYNPLVLKNKFEPIVLSMSLKGDINVSARIEEPSLSQVRETINILLARQKDNIKYDYVPAIWSYESHEITTEESMKQALKIHASAKVLTGIAKADFDYEQLKNSSSEEKYIMVSFRQTLYNAAIDPKHYTQWVRGDIDVGELGAYEPLYISSVDYGRTGYILLKTKKSAVEAKLMIQASISVAVTHGTGSVDVKYSKDLQQLFQDNKVKVKIYGGPVDLANQVTSYEGFKKFVQMPTAETLTKTSVPVSYKVRRLKDNSLVDVLDTYTESYYDLRD